MTVIKAYLFLVGGFVLFFGIWVMIFMTLRKAKPERRDILGPLLMGPFHFYLKKRGYSFSKRELIGWGVVLLIMFLAPWVSFLLEGEKAITGR